MAHKETFISKYIFSQDHKTIARQYLITGIIMGLIGGFLSVLFRLKLGWPNGDLSFLEPILGKWVNGGNLDPAFFLGMVTIHGTILVFWVLTASLSGTFANFLIPLQLGARDMASPFLNMLSYWFFFLSSVIMVASLFVTTGPASSGWTVYPPLSVLPQAMPGSGMGMLLWMLAMVFFIVATMMGGLNYVVTVLNMRTKGMTLGRMPLTIWGVFLTAVLGLVTFPVLLAAAVLLLFDHSLGTSFYLNEIWINGPLGRDGGSPILWQHLLWFLGHPEVYLILMPALGIISEVISTHSRKPIFGYKFMVGSLIAITVLSILVWGHHMFVTGMNPFLGSVFMLATLLIAVPSAIKTYNYLSTLWRGNIRFAPPMLFALGMLTLFVTGGLTGLYLGNAVTDIPLHNTYFVVGHFHLVMGAAAMMGMFAGVYHWFPKMFGRMLDKTLGNIHFWLTIAAIFMVFFPMHFMGLDGVPRRYYQFSAFSEFAEWGGANRLISFGAILGFLAQLIFTYNFFKSIFFGKRASRNPWKANTLEWTTPVNVGHGNWEGPIPHVFRGPHEYSRPDTPHDYLPQTVSDEDLAAGIDYDKEDYDPIWDSVNYKKYKETHQRTSTEAPAE